MEVDVTQIAQNDKAQEHNSTDKELPEQTSISVVNSFEDVTLNDSSCSYENNMTSALNRHSNNKKVIKHSLRQQAKRHKKNSQSGSLPSLSRIIVKQYSQSPIENKEQSLSNTAPTMHEVLASIPGFSIKPRRRSNKKMSAAAQLEQTKEGCIDLETPDSILVNTNLRLLLNKHTFSSLPPLYQYKLVQLLPSVDRPSYEPETCTRLSSSSLNNEFFARACLEWRDRLAEGEFTPENQLKIKSEAEKEKSKLDPWKVKHFEPIWGDKCQGDTITEAALPVCNRPPIKTTIKLRASSSNSSASCMKYGKNSSTITQRLRTVGAVTRASASLQYDRLNVDNAVDDKVSNFIQNVSPLYHKSVLPETKESCFNKVVPESISKTVHMNSPVIDTDIIVPDQLDMFTHNNIDNECDVTRRKSGEKRPRSLSPNYNNKQQKSSHSEVSEDTNEFVLPKIECDTEIADTQVEVVTTEESESSSKTDDDNKTINDFTNNESVSNETIDNVSEDVISNEPKLEMDELKIEEMDDENTFFSIESSDTYNGVLQIQPSSVILHQHTPDDEGNQEEIKEDDNVVLHFNDNGHHNRYVDNFGSDSRDEKSRDEVDDINNVIDNDHIMLNEFREDNSDSFVSQALETLPVNVPVAMAVVNAEITQDDVEVIPMQEELEVRLEEGNFPISQWNSEYGREKTLAPEISPDCSGSNKDCESSLPSYTNQVKLELEVTLTPEDDNSVTSTVGSVKVKDENSKTTNVMTVIPPTTIVCLPAAITNSTIANQMTLNPASSIVSSSLQRTAIVASSSSIPYLSLGTSAPIRAVTQRPKSKNSKDQGSNGTQSNRNRTNNKPPPGAVNLERSYQICQAVIQNSPNRHQLRCQLKPPPSSFLNNISNNNNNHTKKIENRATQYGTVTSSRNVNLQKTFNAQGINNSYPKPPPKPNMLAQRQSPPIVVRHVFTSNQGIPVTMAVLPQATNNEQSIENSGVHMSSSGTMGQYILVQRSVGEHQAAPRASSAPPTNHVQVGLQNHIGSNPFTIDVRGRPASVDVDRNNMPNTLRQITYNNDKQAVNRGDNSMIMDPNHGVLSSQQKTCSTPNSHQQGISSEISCTCNMQAMIVCQKCGAFCHDDCMGTSKLCVSCLIR
ncbi:polycomb protein Asx isoform X3 [Ctenocephalides felis]|uniref:polycomb protein Asx isoform X3 n=1 Tax=Ctenocephalides felis TaxID=7515 RepID=UPI000E6E4C45|nr:polycomb protein Asx isoform X3 [Ctenocephalides felis]